MPALRIVPAVWREGRRLYGSEPGTLRRFERVKAYKSAVAKPTLVTLALLSGLNNMCREDRPRDFRGSIRIKDSFAGLDGLPCFVECVHRRPDALPAAVLDVRIVEAKVSRAA